MLIMLSFLFHKSIVISEAPTYSKIFGYGLGYWLWIAIAGFSIIANLCRVMRQLNYDLNVT